MRIAVVEDHRIYNNLLAKVCRESGHDVVAAVGSGTEAVAAILRERPDLVILDLMLPDLDGFGVVRNVRNRGQSPRFLALSSRCDAYTVYRIEKARIDGYVDKETSIIEELNDAIESIQTGRKYFSAAFRRASEARRADQLAFDKTVSDHKMQILSLIAELKSDQEIADQLGISLGMVARHRRQLLALLGLQSEAELRRYASEKGFTP